MGAARASDIRARLMVALTLVGLVDSAYLTWIHYSGSLALCLGAGGCEAVQTSRYATIGPVPVALIGLLGFVVLLGGGLIRLRDGLFTARAVRLTLFGASLSGTVFAAYLTYLELFVIRAVCPWCIVLAASVVAILVLSLLDLAGTAL